MTAVIPVDDYVSDEWYPGFKQEMFDQPWAIEQTRPLRKEDESRFWFLDFHWPRGFTPMGAATWCEDGYCWGTQYAAETLPLPPGKGFVGRLAGTHLYGTAMPVTNPRELAARGKRLGRTLPGFLGNFAENWAVARDEVDEGWQYFRGLDLTPQSPAELATTLREARAYSRRAYEIHFEVMYPMLANFLGFYGACAEMGLDPSQTGRFLQGEDTKIMQADRALNELTRSARAAGLAPVFAAHEPSELRAALTAHGGSAAQWLTDLDDFLRVHGWRTEGITDIALPSWIEDPTPVFGMVRSFLEQPEDHDFAAAHEAVILERDAAVDAARSGLTSKSSGSSTPGSPPTGRSTSPGGKTSTRSTSTCASRCRCAGRAWRSGARSAPTGPTTPCTCSGPNCSTSPKAARPGRAWPGWWASAAITSGSGTPGDRACPRCWAPSPTRSPTRS